MKCLAGMTLKGVYTVKLEAVELFSSIELGDSVSFGCQ